MPNIEATELTGVLDLTKETFADDRGFFREVFHLDELEKELGHNFVPVQLNHSLSQPNVIRALHAEHWNKLVYPVSGQMFAALVDLRPDSPTFLKVATFTFGDKNRHGLFIPEGVANSICVVGDEPVNYIYLVDKYYTGEDVTAVAWNDPDLAIRWPVTDPIVSDRDENNPSVRALFPDYFSRK